MHYYDADDAYFKIVDTDGPTLFGSMEQTTFPNTYRAMFGFCAKTNSLKTAMFDSIESNNPYAFKILFRCLCEHYLKFMYIWFRFVSEKTDTIGTEYFSFCGAIEAQDYVSAMSIAENLLGNSVTVDIKHAIEQIYPEAAKLSQRELEDKSNQFKYRAILRTFATTSVRFLSKEHPFLAKIIPTYALLSSFVHGGPYADMEMAEFSKPSALEECEHNAGIAFLITASIFMFTATAVAQEKPELASISAKVKKVIKQFTDKTST